MIRRRCPRSIERAACAWLPLLVAGGCATGFPGHTPEDAGVDADGSQGDADGGVTPDGPPPVSEACQEALDGAAFDFEDGPAGWTHDLMPEIAGTDTEWRFDDWEHGEATGVGPAACHGGTGCWATRLDNNYIACQRAYLMSPPLDLSACAGEQVVLSFQHFHDFWSGEWNSQTWFDGGIVELGTDGETWAAPEGLELPGTIAINPNKGIYRCIETDAFYLDGQPGYVGQSGGWQLVEVAVPAELLTAGLLIRFAYSSGVSLRSDTQDASDFANAGWYIDDLAIVPAAAR